MSSIVPSLSRAAAAAAMVVSCGLNSRSVTSDKTVLKIILQVYRILE